MEAVTVSGYNRSSRCSPMVEEISGSDGLTVWVVDQDHAWVSEVVDRVIKYSCSL